MNMTQDAGLIKAVEAAMAGHWDEAHEIVQASGQPTARWIHAVLHKIEGDEWNSRYWYAKTERRYEEYPDPSEELKAIAASLNQDSPSA